MLNKNEFSKFIKPLLLLVIIKSALFIAVLTIILISQQVGFLSENPTITYCDPYINTKISQYQNKIQATLFISTLVATLASLIQSGFFAIYFFKIRKSQNSHSESQIKFSEFHLNFCFIFIFIQIICLINIFSRSIERLKQKSACYIEGQDNSLVFIILSTLNICVIASIFIILFRVRNLIRRKIMTLQEFKQYSDQMNLQQNLLFNQHGYIKDLFKMQNCSTPSHSLKDKVIKNFPSGFKKNQFLTTRQILHRLRGGNRSTTNDQQVKINILSNKNDQNPSKGQGNNQKRDTLNSKEKQNVKSSDENKQSKINYLQVNQKKLFTSPNDDNLRSIETTLNVIELSVNSQKEKRKSQYQDSSQILPQNKTKSKHKNKELFNVKQGAADLNQDLKQNQQQKQKQKQKRIKKNEKSKQICIDQEKQLQQRFNLTPNQEARKNYQKTKNYQNIDQNGNYYVVDVQRIKKRTKFLDSNNSENFQAQILYSKNPWKPKQKRLENKHEKNIQEYLRNLSQLRKQEVLYEDEQSSGSDSFESDSLSSEKSISSHQKQQEGIENTLQAKNEQIKQWPQQPQLYLYLKRRKNLRVEYKMKLYQKEQSSDDNDEQNSNSQDPSQLLYQQIPKEIFQMYNRSSMRKQSIDKSKIEDKVFLKNKQLDTQEARMLRFIRKKYIESAKLKKESKKKLPIIIQNLQPNQTNMQAIPEQNQLKN